MSDRFYSGETLLLGETILEGPEAHHLANVRRFGPGDRIILFNGDGREYAAEVIETSKKRVHLRIIGAQEPARELGITLHVASALPKGDRGDFLIEKLTELGVTNFTPLVTARSIVQPKASIVEKIQRAVIEASKQCGRNVLMRVHPPMKFDDWLRLETLPTQRWIAHPDGALMGPPTRLEAIAIAIGPEGGFTEAELVLANQCGFAKRSLGPRILRVETAALMLAAWVGLCATAPTQSS
jgi:16S rRNA (uracil1498-N3)-methyltransferase